MYHVKKDSREQEAGTGWTFSPTKNCSGTTTEKLDTGDYTIVGYEDLFVIERKGALTEWAHNVNEARFDKEMQRLEKFRWPFIILEFTLQDLLNWPNGCNIPKNKIKSIKMTNYALLKKTNEYMIAYKTKIIFAGKHGKEIAASLFKRVMEHGK